MDKANKALKLAKEASKLAKSAIKEKYLRKYVVISAFDNLWTRPSGNVMTFYALTYDSSLAAPFHMDQVSYNQLAYNNVTDVFGELHFPRAIAVNYANKINKVAGNHAEVLSINHFKKKYSHYID